MKFFYLSSVANENGLHIVHDRDCELIPDAYDRDYLGPYNTGSEALRKAQTMKNVVGLCENCCVSSQHSYVTNPKDIK